MPERSGPLSASWHDAAMMTDVRLAADKPASPFPNQVFYASDEDEYFRYDATRDKWLGFATYVYMAGESATVANAYLTVASNFIPVTGAVETGYRTGMKLTLIKCTSQKFNNTAAVNFEVHTNGVSGHTNAHLAGARNTNSEGLDVDYGGAGAIQFYVAGTLTSGGHVFAFFKHRLDNP